VEGRVVHVNLDNVLYVPPTLQTKVNLFSVPILTDHGLHCDLRPVDCKFTLDGEILAGGTKIGNSWWLDTDTRSHSICMAMRDNGQGENPETLQTWHQRLGHLNKRDIKRLQEAAIGVVIGTPKIPCNKIQCTSCLVGKDHRKICKDALCYDGGEMCIRTLYNEEDLYE